MMLLQHVGNRIPRTIEEIEIYGRSIQFESKRCGGVDRQTQGIGRVMRAETLRCYVVSQLARRYRVSNPWMDHQLQTEEDKRKVSFIK